MQRCFGPVASFALTLTLVACGGNGSAPSHVPPITGAALNAEPSYSTVSLRGKIQHVVVIIQENRSFDNLFADFPGADTVTSGTSSTGERIPLQPVSLTAAYDVGHEESDFLQAFDGGKMDGFNLEDVGGVGGSGSIPGGQQATPPTPPNPQYAYVPAAERQPYTSMASSYVLADRFFPSQIDSSFTAHQYLIAAQAGNAVDNPPPPIWGCDAVSTATVPTLNADRSQGPGVFPCFDYQTLADELDAANHSWRYYAPPLSAVSIWSAYDAIRHIRYGSDWTANVVSPETRILDDIAAGTLADVTWVVPDGVNSDHSGIGYSSGPQWVASLVDSIGASRFWPSTAIIVLWDDWGGWYDHVAPPQLDTHGLGIRTPLMVISPFAKRGYVSHVQYESGSVVRFIETQFALPALAASDARANDLGDAFNAAAGAAPFRAFGSVRATQRYRSERPSMLPPDSD